MDSFYDPCILVGCPFSHLRDLINSRCRRSSLSLFSFCVQHTDAKQLHTSGVAVCSKYIVFFFFIFPTLRQSRKLNEIHKTLSGFEWTAAQLHLSVVFD